MIWENQREKIRPFKVTARFEDENKDEIRGDLAQVSDIHLTSQRYDFSVMSTET